MAVEKSVLKKESGKTIVEITFSQLCFNFICSSAKLPGRAPAVLLYRQVYKSLHGRVNIVQLLRSNF